MCISLFDEYMDQLESKYELDLDQKKCRHVVLASEDEKIIEVSCEYICQN